MLYMRLYINGLTFNEIIYNRKYKNVFIANKMEQLATFIKRLERIGIEVKLVANIPWIYLRKINGKLVTEKYNAEHGFTIAFLPVRKDKSFRFTELSEIFKLIRKYCK